MAACGAMAMNLTACRFRAIPALGTASHEGRRPRKNGTHTNDADKFERAPSSGKGWVESAIPDLESAAGRIGRISWVTPASIGLAVYFVGVAYAFARVAFRCRKHGSSSARLVKGDVYVFASAY